MEALKILIVEDDILLAERISEDLLGLGYTIVDKVGNSEEAISSFRTKQPDIVILDIDLKGSRLDGIDIAHVFNGIKRIPIIFLSGIGGNETIERAKKVHPAYYLIKPYNLVQLNICIDFALENHTLKKEANIQHSLGFHQPQKDSLYINDSYFFAKKDNKRYVKIEIAEILWVEAITSSIRVYTEKDNFVFSLKLLRFQERILNPNLMRIHKSYIVNVEKVVAYEYKNVVIMHRDQEKIIPIGRKYKKLFQESIPRLMSE